MPFQSNASQTFPIQSFWNNQPFCVLLYRNEVAALGICFRSDLPLFGFFLLFNIQNASCFFLWVEKTKKLHCFIISKYTNRKMCVEIQSNVNIEKISHCFYISTYCQYQRISQFFWEHPKKSCDKPTKNRVILLRSGKKISFLVGQYPLEWFCLYSFLSYGLCVCVCDFRLWLYAWALLTKSTRFCACEANLAIHFGYVYTTMP